MPPSLSITNSTHFKVDFTKLRHKFLSIASIPLWYCSASSDHKNMKCTSLESSYQDELNGSGFIVLSAIDED
jgi:hypothetical protein